MLIFLNCTIFEVCIGDGIKEVVDSNISVRVVRAAWTYPARRVRPGIISVAPSTLVDLHH